MAVNVDIQPNKNLSFLWASLNRRRAGENLPWFLLEGSSRSGKTWAIISFLAVLCMKPEIIGQDSIVVRAYRNDGTTCRDTIVADFIEIMTHQFGGEGRNGQWVSAFDSAGVWNKSTLTYTFENGSTFSFHGASDPQKLQGKKATISWFNEAMEISNDAQFQISIRTTFLKIADWNPSQTDHWIFDTIMANGSPYAYCHSTYFDNLDNLTAEQVYEIEKTKPIAENIARGTADANKWLVYGEGRRGVRENLVFERYRWDLIDDADYPARSVCQRSGNGVDFGYSQDPTALIDCALQNDALFFRQVVYKRGLLVGRSYDNPNVPSLVGLMNDLDVSKSARMYGDCAAPEAIAQLRAAGYNAQGMGKGAGSILAGLELLKHHRIFITRSSQDLIREFENYSFVKKPNGEITDVPEDRNNHGIDAIRYWALGNLTPSALGVGRPNRGAILPKARDFEDW